MDPLAAEYCTIAECVDIEIINFLNNFYGDESNVVPVLVFPPGMGVIFYKYIRYISSLYNVTPIYVGRDHFRTIAILRIDHLKRQYKNNYKIFFDYSYEDSEPVDPSHIQRQLNISLSSNVRKRARRHLGLPLNKKYQLTPEMQLAERIMTQWEERGRARRSSGALCSVGTSANPDTQVTLFNYGEIQAPQMFPAQGTYKLLPTFTGYPMYPLYTLPLITRRQRELPTVQEDHFLEYVPDVELVEAEPELYVQEVNELEDVEEIGEASGISLPETEDITSEVEALKIQNLGEPYEKEYGKYMYDTNNLRPDQCEYHNTEESLRISPMKYSPVSMEEQQFEEVTTGMSSLTISPSRSGEFRERVSPGFTSDVHSIRCVPNKPFSHVFTNLNDAFEINQLYKEEIAEYVQGSPLIVLASENYSPYKELMVFTMDHIIEIYDFPASFFSHNFLTTYREEPRYLKWCDDTHTLLVTASEDQARRALRVKNRLMKSRPLSEGSPIAITIACQYLLQQAHRSAEDDPRGNRVRRLLPAQEEQEFYWIPKAEEYMRNRYFQ